MSPVVGGGGTGAVSLIQKQTLAAPAATVTFSAIPQTFDSLLLVATTRDDSVGGVTTLNWRLNQLAGGNYYNQRIRGAAAAASGVETLAQTFGVCGLNTSDFNAASTVPAVSRALFPNYTATAWNRLVIGESYALNGSASGNLILESFGSMYAASVAISRLDFFANAGGANFKTGSIFALYGIGS